MSSVIRQIPLATSTQHHAHDFHQIVIGLQVRAEFEIEGLGGVISAFSGCIVPTNHVHYYMGQGKNHQLILDLPTDTAALTGHHHELARLFDAPRFFALDEPLKRYLEFLDRKSTRLNSSHVRISYAVFCLKKKKIFKYLM